jgi:hypothetical protein
MYELNLNFSGLMMNDLFSNLKTDASKFQLIFIYNIKIKARGNNGKGYFAQGGDKMQ